MGVYVFKASVLRRVLEHYCNTDRGYDFGHDIIPSLVGSDRTFAYNFRHETQEMPRYWRDVGTLDSYYEASIDLVRLQAPFDPHIRHAVRSMSLPIKIGASVAGTAHVAQSVLSPGVRIGEHASVDGSVLMPSVHVGRGARLRGVIVDEGVAVPPGFEAGFDVEHDRTRFTVTEKGIVVISGDIHYNWNSRGIDTHRVPVRT
jgi:glucose-1-phosphate adenylyltransferase